MWLRTMRFSAAWMSAAGSKRVKVVQRKFIGLLTARAGSSVTTTSGQSASAGSRASRLGASVSAEYAGPRTTRQPGQKTSTSLTSEPSVADGENACGSVRTGSPNPSHTPFDPLFTSGPV